MTEHEPRAGCASEVGVVKMSTAHRAYLEGARALGCLMPDEAAALRATIVSYRQHMSREAVRYAGREDERNALAARLKVAEEALEACEGYFDNRADAENDSDGTHPNIEMRLLDVVRAVLTPAKGDAP